MSYEIGAKIMKHWYTFIPIPLSIALFDLTICILYKSGFLHAIQFIGR